MIVLRRLDLVRQDSHATADELQSLQLQLNDQFQFLRNQLLDDFNDLIWSTGTVMFSYDFSTVTTEPPTGSQIRVDVAHPWTTVNKCWIRTTTTTGQDLKGLLMVITPDSTLYIQNKTTSAQYLLMTTTGSPVDKGTYVEFPVAWKQNGTALLNNQNVQLIIIRHDL